MLPKLLWHYRASRIFLGWLSGTLLLTCLSVAQAPPQPSQPSSGSVSSPGEPKISQQEADELFKSLDSILHFASDDSRLRIHDPVKRKLVGRDAVESNLRDRLKDDEDAKRLRRAEVVLKKFGFLPRDFDLQNYLVSMLREQVAGFYNFHDQTVYLLDWIPAQQQKPIMAHELTHALQDQNVQLESWLRGKSRSERNNRNGSNHGKETAQSDQEEIESDEVETARQALVEGQGMAVMIDYLLKDSNQNVMTATYFVNALEQSMQAPHDSPVLSRAPMYLQESLAFPYSYGLEFVRQLLLKGGRKLAYEGALKDPPRNTRQVMIPKTYFSHEELEPVRLPDMGKILGEGYQRYDVGSVGEFDVMVLLKQFAGEKVASELSPEWRGGAYYAALRPEPIGGQKQLTTMPGADSAKVAPVTTESIALFYLSRWKSAEAAKQFAAAYAATLPRRYRSVQPAVDAGAKAGAPTKATLTSRWQTEEGAVVIEAEGDTVLAMESFDSATILRLREAVWDRALAAAHK